MNAKYLDVRVEVLAVITKTIIVFLDVLQNKLFH